MADLAEELSKKNENARLQKIRQSMVLAVAMISDIEPFRDRIQAAADVQALWALRDELMNLVDEHHDHQRAKELLLPITSMFLNHE